MRIIEVAPNVPLAKAKVIILVENLLIQTNELSHYATETKEFIPPVSLELDRIPLSQGLYNALFQDSVKHSWITAQKLPNQPQELLRLCLGWG